MTQEISTPQQVLDSVDPSSPPVIVAQPVDGAVVELDMAAARHLQFKFELAGVDLVRDGADLVLVFEDGSVLILLSLFGSTDGESSPLISLADGRQVLAETILPAQKTNPGLDPASGPDSAENETPQPAPEGPSPDSPPLFRQEGAAVWQLPLGEFVPQSDERDEPAGSLEQDIRLSQVVSGPPSEGTSTEVSAEDGAEANVGAETAEEPVSNTNSPPTAIAPQDQSSVEGEAFSLDLSPQFSDPDSGDSLTYEASGLPAGFSLDSGTGLVNGTPHAGNVGGHEITVTATDSTGAQAALSFTLTVAADETGYSVQTGSIGADSLSGGNGADLLYGIEGADDLSGGNGADKIFGGDGADTITGGNGDDMLIGGGGADSLVGGRGDDTFWDGDGLDILTGGKGNDIFRLTDGDGESDIITDFDQEGSDVLDLSEIITLGSGDDITQFLSLEQDGADTKIVHTDANGVRSEVALLQDVTGLDVTQLFQDAQLIVTE